MEELMKIKFLSLLLTFFGLNFTAEALCELSFSQWYTKCLSQPENLKLIQPSTISANDLMQVLAQYTSAADKELKNGLWINQKDPRSFTYVQKLVVPAHSKIFMFGDLHGKIHSLMRLLAALKSQHIIDDNFAIKPSNVYFMFLGDYVDRGLYGIEVIYTLLCLKLANPDRVFLVRGNHEDCSLNNYFGFYKELAAKFGDQAPSVYVSIAKFYQMLPAAIYLGCASQNHINFVQCCHGGLEIGYNAKELLTNQNSHAYQWITTIERKNQIRALPTALKNAVLYELPEHEIIDFVPQEPTKPTNLGFLWNDFIVENDTDVVQYNNGRGWVFGKSLTNHILKTNSTSKALLRGIIRAHQHYGPMLKLLEQHHGLVNLWDGMVYTLLSAPVDASFSYDACTLLTTAPMHEQWTLQPIWLKPTA
jgi:hypothetical protein